MSTKKPAAISLKNLDDWEDDLLRRYPDPQTITNSKSKPTKEYRNYETPAKETVKEFYRLNHTFQTHEFAMGKRKEYLKFDKKRMPVWEAFNFLNRLVDDSDPD